MAVLLRQAKDDCLVVSTLVGLAADRVAEPILAEVAQYAALHLAVVVGHAAEGLLVESGVLADVHVAFHKIYLLSMLYIVKHFDYSYFGQNKLLLID